MHVTMSFLSFTLIIIVSIVSTASDLPPSGTYFELKNSVGQCIYSNSDLSFGISQCISSTDQLWTKINYGSWGEYFAIKSKHSGRCLFYSANLGVIHYACAENGEVGIKWKTYDNGLAGIGLKTAYGLCLITLMGSLDVAVALGDACSQPETSWDIIIPTPSPTAAPITHGIENQQTDCNVQDVQMPPIGNFQLENRASSKCMYSNSEKTSTGNCDSLASDQYWLVTNYDPTSGYVILQSENTNKCLRSLNNHPTIPWFGVYTCGNGDDVKWELVNIDGEYFSIKSKTNGKCIYSGPERFSVAICDSSDKTQQWRTAREGISCSLPLKYADTEAGETSTLTIKNTFNIINGGCINPKISFNFVTNDHNGPHEYINIYQGLTISNDNFISRCDEQSTSCIMKTCLSNYAYNWIVNHIDITVYVSQGVDGMNWDGSKICQGTQYEGYNVIDAVLTLTCQRGLTDGQMPPNGVFMLINMVSNKCLDGASATECDKGIDQHLKRINYDANTGYFQLQTQNPLNCIYLNANGGFGMDSCNTGSDQKWKLVSNDGVSFALKSYHSKCIYSQDSGGFGIVGCSTSPDQRWKFVPVLEENQATNCDLGSVTAGSDISCGLNVKYADIEAGETSPMIILNSFNIENGICVNPRLSFTFLTNDHDDSNEYFELYEGMVLTDEKKLTACTQQNQACIMETCISNEPFTLSTSNTNPINIVVYVSRAVDGMSHNGDKRCIGTQFEGINVIDAVLTITCQGGVIDWQSPPTYDFLLVNNMRNLCLQSDGIKATDCVGASDNKYWRTINYDEATGYLQLQTENHLKCLSVNGGLIMTDCNSEIMEQKWHFVENGNTFLIRSATMRQCIYSWGNGNVGLFGCGYGDQQWRFVRILKETLQKDCNLEGVSIGEDISCSLDVKYADIEAGETSPLIVSNTFNILNGKCINPRISMDYLTNDHDDAGEYIEVYTGLTVSGSKIATCARLITNCIKETCLSNYGLNWISNPVEIAIFVSHKVDGMGHDGSIRCVGTEFEGINTIDATITLTCKRGLSDGEIPPSGTIQLINRDSKKCIYASSDGVNIGATTCDTKSAYQFWKATNYESGTGYFRIENQETNACMLSFTDSYFIMYGCNDGNGQKFRLIYNDGQYFSLKNQRTGRCIYSSNEGDFGTAVCDTSDNQQWRPASVEVSKAIGSINIIYGADGNPEAFGTNTGALNTKDLYCGADRDKPLWAGLLSINQDILNKMQLAKSDDAVSNIFEFIECSEAVYIAATLIVTKFIKTPGYIIELVNIILSEIQKIDLFGIDDFISNKIDELNAMIINELNEITPDDIVVWEIDEDQSSGELWNPFYHNVDDLADMLSYKICTFLVGDTLEVLVNNLKNSVILTEIKDLFNTQIQSRLNEGNAILSGLKDDLIPNLYKEFSFAITVGMELCIAKGMKACVTRMHGVSMNLNGLSQIFESRSIYLELPTLTAGLAAEGFVHFDLLSNYLDITATDSALHLGISAQTSGSSKIARLLEIWEDHSDKLESIPFIGNAADIGVDFIDGTLEENELITSILTGGAQARLGIIYNLPDIDCNGFRVSLSVGDYDSFGFSLFFGYEYKQNGVNNIPQSLEWIADTQISNFDNIQDIMLDVSVEAINIFGDAFNKMGDVINDFVNDLSTNMENELYNTVNKIGNGVVQEAEDLLNAGIDASNLLINNVNGLINTAQQGVAIITSSIDLVTGQLDIAQISCQNVLEDLLDGKCIDLYVGEICGDDILDDIGLSLEKVCDPIFNLIKTPISELGDSFPSIEVVFTPVPTIPHQTIDTVINVGGTGSSDAKVDKQSVIGNKDNNDQYVINDRKNVPDIIYNEDKYDTENNINSLNNNNNLPKNVNTIPSMYYIIFVIQAIVFVSMGYCLRFIMESSGKKYQKIQNYSTGADTEEN